jgi:hypothetical protein
MAAGGAEHHVAVLAADDPKALGIDILDLEARHLGALQAGG